MPTKSKKKGQRKVTPRAKRKTHGGLLNGYWSSRSEMTRSHIHSWFRVVVLGVAILGFGKTWWIKEITAPAAEAVIERTIKPAIDSLNAEQKVQTKTMIAISKNVDLNSQAILNLNETMNLQFEWFKKELDDAREERTENRTRLNNMRGTN